MSRLNKIALIIVMGLLIVGCVARRDYQKLESKYNADVASMSAHMKDLNNSNETLTQENQKMAFEIKTLQLKIDELEGKLSQYDATMKQLQDSVILKLNALKGEGVIVSGNAVDIQGEILFDPGTADLKQKGKEVLKKIAEILKSEPGYMIQISGHTDTDKIEMSAEQWKTKSNFELAAHRALNVLLYMKEQGIDPAKMYLSSFGEYRPKGEKKSENRRVEISFTKIPASGSVEKTPAPEKEPSK